MTLAEKLAALPEMPKLPRPPEWTSVANQMSYYIHKGAARGARLSLLLETVRAVHDAEDAHGGFYHVSHDGMPDEEYRAAQVQLIEARRAARHDLRTLQAHLEGERT